MEKTDQDANCIVRKIRSKDTAVGTSIEISSVDHVRKMNSIVERQSQETSFMYKTNYSELYEPHNLQAREPARVASSGTQTMQTNSNNRLTDLESLHTPEKNYYDGD
jgi:hypothetical protein